MCRTYFFCAYVIIGHAYVIIFAVAVLQIASLLPESVLPSLSANLFDQLTTLSDVSLKEDSAQPLMLLRCLFAWNRGVQVLDLLASAIEAGSSGAAALPSAAAASASSSSAKRRRPKTAAAAAAAPLLLHDQSHLKKLPSPIVSMKLLSLLLSDSQLRVATLSAVSELDRVRVALMRKWFPYAVPAARAEGES